MGFVFVIMFRPVMMKFSSARAINIFSYEYVVYLGMEYSFSTVKVSSVAP